MSNNNTFIHQLKKIKSEIEGKVSEIFDGTTRLGKTVAIIISIVDAEWAIHQHLICVQLLAKSFTGDGKGKRVTLCTPGSVRCSY